MITIDFETFYDKDFSLSKLTTEEYVRDDRFEVIGVAVKVNDEPTEWFSGDHEQTLIWLQQFNWGDHFVLAHNAVFDAAILTWRFGIRPKAWLDTLSMARAVLGPTASVSLAKLVEHFGIGQKGHEVEDAKGFRRADFTPQHLAQYASYCVNDVELTYKLFKELDASFPTKEKRLIDLTIRMFSDPVLELDEERLKAHLQDVQERKRKLFTEANITPEILNSNKKFAALLESFGVVPPMKISPTTDKETYAFAKSDEDFLRLLDHSDERVQAIVAARIGAKSTLEESRTQRFIDIAGRTPDHKLPIPLKYYAAHTGRWGGSDAVNLQNLPSRGEQKNKLKRCITAPKGHVIIDCDSSQIEARVLAWLAGQTDVLAKFSLKQDVYKYMASTIYGKPESAVTDHERFIGKTTVLGCIAEGTLVLSDSGWKPIEQVTLTDKLWDGEEWVCHQGLQNSGIKETLNLCGIWLTPDHRVWSGTQWLEAQSVVQDDAIRFQALGTAAENLPSQATYGVTGVGYQTSSCAATATASITAWTPRTSRASRAPAAHCAPRLRRTLSGSGSIQTRWPMTSTELGYSTDFLLQSHDATRQAVKPTSTTGDAAYRSHSSGEKTALRFSGTFKRWTAGIVPSLRWTVSTSMGTTHPATSGSSPAAKTSETNAGSPTSKRRLQTYDLAYAGPRNRYTILTEDGPLIVHNCGYGMGAIKFQMQLQNMGHKLDLDTCKHIIKQYRYANTRISHWWTHLNQVLEWMLTNKAGDRVDDPGVLTVTPFTGIGLPNGMFINYPELRRETVGGYSYMTRQGRNRIYGGKVAENLCQAVARCIIGDQMLRVAKRYKVVLTVHDAVACVARTDERDDAMRYVSECMSWTPEWAEGLPLACEVGVGSDYGECSKKMSIEKWGL